MITATGVILQTVKEQHFNRNWKIELLKDKTGYTVAICHFNCPIKTAFRFDKKEATDIYNGWIKDFKKMGKK